MDQKIKPKSTGKKGFNIYWVYGILFVIFIALNFLDFSPKAKEIDLYRLQSMISSQDVEKIIVVNREKAEIFIKPDALKKNNYDDLGDKSDWTGSTKHQYYYTISSIETFETEINK